MDACKDCFYVQFTPCNTIGVELNLVADTTYYLWIKDKFGNWYTKEILTDNHGNFTFDPSVFPEGLFEVGSFLFYVSTSEIENTMEAVDIDNTIYSCFVFTRDANILGSFDNSFDKSHQI